MKEKIAFISCVNNEEEYSKAIKFIEELYVPENIEVQIISIWHVEGVRREVWNYLRRSYRKY